MKRILILDDNLTICLMLKSWLSKEGYEVGTSTSVSEAKEKVKEKPYDLILSDIRMPDTDGFSFLSWIKRYDSDIVVIMMTGFSDIETAVGSMKSGAADYISKPIEPELLFKKINEAFKKQLNNRNAKNVANTFTIPPGEIYAGLFRKIDGFIHNNAHFLITGARGTGKTSFVKYAHEKGFQNKAPLVVMDCVENDGGGVFEKAENSTFSRYLNEAKGGLLFVKNVDNLNAILQTELVLALQKQSKNESFIQIVLSSKYDKNTLKRILLPKLFQIFEAQCVELPSLKGQEEDILFFANYFLNFANIELNKNIKNIAPEIQRALIDHDWKGNIQELKNTLLKAALLTDGSTISSSILLNLFKNGHEITPTVSVTNLQGLKKENYEKEKIIEALELAKGNKTMAASLLNMDRKTLYNKIKLYRVEVNS